MFKPTKMLGAAAMAMAMMLPAHSWASPTPAGTGGVNEFSTLVFVNYDPVTGVYSTAFVPRLFGQYINVVSDGHQSGTVTIATPIKGGTGSVSGLVSKVGTSSLGSGPSAVNFDVYKGTVTSSTDPRLHAGAAVISLDVYGNAYNLNYATFGVWTLKKRAKLPAPKYAGAFAGAQPGNVFSTSMPTSGSASYAGGAVGFVNANGNAADWAGTLALTANFAAIGGTISGSITNIAVYDKNSGTSVGSLNNLTLNLGSFAKKTFFGSVSANTTAGTYANLAGGSGLYKGAFYGPSAAEVAGVFHFSGTNVHLTGSFGGHQ